MAKKSSDNGTVVKLQRKESQIQRNESQMQRNEM